MKRRKDAGGRSFGFQLTASFMACMAMLLVFVAASLITPLSDLLEQNAIDRTKETVLQSVSTMNIFVDRLLSTLYFSTTVLPDDVDGGVDGWVGQMNLIKKSNSDVLSIALFHQDGSLLGSTGASAVSAAPEEIRETEWFQKALNWGGTVTYFSAPHVQHLFSGQRTYVITLARSVFYQKGEQTAQGVVLMDVEYSSFSSLIDNVTLGSSGYIYVLDRQGELIAHPRLQLIYSGLAEENLTELSRFWVGQGRDEMDGRERVLISATLDQTRWRMVGVAYIDELLALQNTFVRLIMAVLVCAVLLSVAVATVMSYRLMRPIRRFAGSISRVESGDLNVTIPETGFREVRDISAAFNRMLARIRALMDQIVQEQEKKRLYELNALQAQINPHFLYNTLDSIIWMEERGRNREAIVMVSSLAKFFRISISKGRSEITVREELEQVRNYLIIQKMRFKDKFTYEITCDEAALGETTVKLIVQPMVENVINHAIDETQSEALHISIHAGVTEDELIFTVADDGVGMPPEVVEQLLVAPAGKSGIGIKNVHERIQLTYGEQYGLKVESVEDEGTTVIIRLPRTKGGEAR